jgi:hypothetical protein
LIAFVSRAFSLRWMPREMMNQRGEITILLTPFPGPNGWNPLPLLLRKFTAGST